MKQTIYVDVLICVNIFINYFLLLSVSKILNLTLVRKKLILSASVGAIYSLTILLPPVNWALSLLIKLAMSASIVLLAFKWVSLKLFLKAFMTFYGVNFLFGGIIFFLWYFVTPNGIFINNSMIYLNLSPLFLVLATFASYLAIRLIHKTVGRQDVLAQANCDVLIEFEGKSVILKAKVDTGNTLKEPFSGLPVIVAQRQFVETILPAQLREYFCVSSVNSAATAMQIYEAPSPLVSGFRLVPFKTISGDGLLPAFKASSIKILSKTQNIAKDAYVAVCSEKIFNNECQALINSELIE